MASFAPFIIRRAVPAASKRQAARKVEARAPKPAAPARPAAVAPSGLTNGLSVSQPADLSERQADAMAERALSGAETPGPGRDVARDGKTRSGDSPWVLHRVLSGAGQPLPPGERAFFEPRFNRDLSQVRIHADEPAARSARRVGALAYTLGSHIAFAAGQYQPGSPRGRQLLAHELAHTVQPEAGAPLLHRQAAAAAPAPAAVSNAGAGTSDLDAAIAASDWPQAAEILNGYNPEGIRAILAKHGRGFGASIYVGALNNPRLGDKSAVAEATHVAYLDINLDNEMKRNSWKDAAKFLNAFSRNDILQHLQKLDISKVQALHDGAVANLEVGPQSQLAEVTAMLIARQKNAPVAEGAVEAVDKTVPHKGDPLADPNYIEKTTKGIGIPIWGGPFYLKQSDAPGWGDSVVVPRDEVAAVDPFAALAVQLSQVYVSRAEALKAVQQSGVDGAYAFYQGPQGRILPTILSATTAPELTKSAQLAMAAERRDAKAASNLGFQLLIWYLGARVPAKIGAGGEAAAAAQGVKSSLPAILGETQYAALKAAAEAAKAAHPEIASLTVDEIIAIRAYSAESWSYLNQALRLKDAKELTRLGEFINLMRSGLSKLPFFKGTLTRTIALQVPEAAAKYKVGATVVEDAFTSTTFGKAVAQREGNVALTVESLTGHDITAVAAHNESEVLFAPGARFVVTRVIQSGHAFLVWLKEIP